MIEPLESRIAPAAVLPYTDADGDSVKISVSGKCTLAELTTAAHFVAGAHGQQLTELDLNAAIFEKANVTVSVSKKDATNGDGLVDVGFIKATGIDLGAVNVHGDLGVINAGDKTIAHTPAVRSLTLNSFGSKSTTTGAPGSLESSIVGTLGSLHVAKDVDGVFLNVTDGFAAGDGKIGLIRIGGNLSGESADDSGFIQTTGAIGPVTIVGGLTGNDGEDSGSINSPVSMGAVTIGGSIVGGAGANSGKIQTNGTLASIKVGGDLIGGGDEQCGSIYAQTIKSVSIGGYVQGGSGDDSGSIVANSNLGTVSIRGFLNGSSVFGGSLIGGSGAGSGEISSESIGGIRKVTISRDVLGGSSDQAGSIISFGSIGSVAIGGSLIGLGAGTDTGSIETTGSMTSIGTVKIAHDVQGGPMQNSGRISAFTSIQSVTIGGGLQGGAGSQSGEISSHELGTIKIAGSVKGDVGDDSGSIEAGDKLTSLTVGGDLDGGADSNGNGGSGLISATNEIVYVNVVGEVNGSMGGAGGEITSGTIDTVLVGGLTGGDQLFNGSIFASDLIKSVTVANDVQGGSGEESGSIQSEHSIGNVTVKGSVKGGSNDSTGEIFTSTGDIGIVSIGGDLLGGTTNDNTGYDHSGTISSAGKLAKVTIHGSVNGGSGSKITFFGSILSNGDMGPVSIGGNLHGGTNTGTGSILDDGTIFSTGSVASISIGGSIQHGVPGSGQLLDNASIFVTNNLGSLYVKGSIEGLGNVANDSVVAPVVIAAGGSAAHPLAIGSITVGGSVSYAQILAGFTDESTPVNADASIGAVKVGGSWHASDLVAGVKNTASNTQFGNANDALISGGSAAILASIKSIVIGGTASGSLAGGDHFGFVAEQIGSFKANGVVTVLAGGAHNDDIVLNPGTDNDLTIHEV